MKPTGKHLSKADALFQRAFHAHRAGKFAEAEEYYRKALRLEPRDLETLYLLGTVCSQQGKREEAVTFLKRAFAINPNHAETVNNLALTLKELDRHNESLEYYLRALSLRPDYADAHANLANLYVTIQRLEDAEMHARKALELNPDHAMAWCNLGLVHKAHDRFEEAANCFLRGLEHNPGMLLAHEELGSIYKIWGRMDKALACFDYALSLQPNSYGLHNNRATVLEELGRYDEAQAEYERAVELNPESGTAQWNMSYFFLRQGKLDLGWDYHELRLRKEGQVLMRFPFPNWDGTSLSGKRILVFAEQGLGDEIYYASCIPDIIAQAGHCVIECDKRLAPLFARSFPQATVQGADRLDITWLLSMPKFDVQSPIGSLPRFVRRSFDSFPDRAAYLVPDHEAVQRWKSRLADMGPEFKVGICWRSSVAKGERHRQYSQLSQWTEIFNVPGVRFINLQYDECTDELNEAREKFGIDIVQFEDIDLRNDIDGCAALMKSLDLVITAATAVSEIAASVGVEVFRLDAVGRQMDSFGTDHSPWHPTMRLFGQPAFGDWDTPLALAGAALRERVSHASSAVEYVPLKDGSAVAVSGFPDDLHAYVLKEQGCWFDEEYGFVLSLVGEGARVVDVGAGIGEYAVPLARRAGDGMVLALTRDASETSLLMRSRASNHLEKVLHVATVDEGLSLDAEMDRYGLDEIGLVRVSRDRATPTLLSGCTRFFSRNSPLVMFGVQSRSEFDPSAADWFVAQGYSLYRLVPGLELLVPFASANELDAYARYLFACRPERADALERAGVLARGVHVLTDLPGIDKPYWQACIGSMPFAEDLIRTWTEPGNRQADWEVYWMALNLYAMSRDSERSGAERHAALLAAAGVLRTLVESQANLPRLLSLCRILGDLGNREAVVTLLNHLGGMINAGLSRFPAEPCLPLSDEYARMRVGNRAEEWVISMMLEHRERLRAFSTYFTGQESLAALEEVRDSGFATDAVLRRISLIKSRPQTNT